MDTYDCERCLNPHNDQNALFCKDCQFALESTLNSDEPCGCDNPGRRTYRLPDDNVQCAVCDGKMPE